MFYSDVDPTAVVREEPAPYESTGFNRDATFGAGAAEIELTELLGENRDKPE